MQCPICEEGELRIVCYPTATVYREQEIIVDLLYSICPACGSEQANAAQLSANKQAMIKVKKEIDLEILKCAG